MGDWTTYRTYPWHPNDPDGSDPVNCVRLIKSGGNFVWADRSCGYHFKYLCGRPHENGFIRREYITLLYDNSEWEFLMNRDTTQCQPLKPEQDNFLLQTLMINQLPASEDKTVKVVMYFQSQISCHNVNILRVLTPKCSGKSHYEKCIVFVDSGPDVNKVCIYNCPLKINEDKVSISFITNPFYDPGNATLCEIEVFYKT